MNTITKQQLIGEDIEIIDAKNKANIGITGKIINETKNTIEVKTSDSRKKLIKKNITILLKEKKIKINGELLIGRPEERIKKKTRN